VLERVKSALNIVRRINPKNSSENLKSLISISPDVEEHLLQRIDQPFTVSKDDFGNSFIECEYNRDGNSYRSPFSNKYIPSLPSSNFFPSYPLREIELLFNKKLNLYTDLYYDSETVGSAYFWDLDKESFACAVVIRNEVAGKRVTQENYTQSKSLTSGEWNSINVVEVTKVEEDKYKYKCFSTVYIYLNTNLDEKKKDTAEINGFNTYSNEVQKTVDLKNLKHCHVVNIGELVESNETEIRNNIMDVFLARMDDAISNVAEKVKDKKKCDVQKNLMEEAMLMVRKS